MTDEEKEALEILNNTEWDGFMITIKNLIEKQSKEIEYQKEKRENQKKELAILNAKQIEFNKIVNTVNSYKGQFKRQQKEIEELKEDNKKYIDLHYVPYEQYTSKLNELNKKWQDKIKAKIEDIESQINDIKDNLDYEYNETMVNEVWRLENKIDVLQSLLEKE